MRSFRIGALRGIPIFAHPTLALVALLFLLQLGLWGLPAFVLLFASIVLHELGHAEVARRFGIPVPRIDLHLLGGTASMASAPRTPREEILVAAAGPAVSMALALGLGAAGSALVALGGGVMGELILYGAAANLMLAVFNLLPALPMDGGRIFRAALAARLGGVKATEVAATVSRVFGGLFVLGAFFAGSVSLGLIGLLLFFLAGQEERFARMRGPYTTGPVPSFRGGYRPPRWAHHGYGASEPSAAEVVDVDPGHRRFVDPWGRVWTLRVEPERPGRRGGGSGPSRGG